MAEVTGAESRPGAVSAGVWLVITGGVLLAAGGLVIGSASFETLRQVAPASVPDESVRTSLWLYRGLGLLFALSAAGLIGLALRAGRRDPRSRRATVALGMAVVVLVAVAAFVAGSHILVLLSVFVIITGSLLLSRPAALAWFAGGADLEVEP